MPEQDPRFAERIPQETRALAQRHLRARVRSLRHGPLGVWEALEGPYLGLLVLDGLLMQQIRIGGRSMAEILGPGDVLRPWEVDDAGIEPAETTWRALTPVRMAELDRDFAVRARHWPEVAVEVSARASRRARSLALQAAISHIRRVDGRLLHLLSHLALRWGRVTPEGVVLELRLSHAALGELVGARRPSVTTAVGSLARQGLCVRRPDGAWLLSPTMATEVSQPRALPGTNGAGGRSLRRPGEVR